MANCSRSDTFIATWLVQGMATVSNGYGSSAPQIAPSRRSFLRWLLYCWGLCLELLGMAFMGAVVVVFFGRADARLLLSLTAVGMLTFYSGWFCVRQASRGAAKAVPERG
jgi:L-asparagine transporter-like permease